MTTNRQEAKLVILGELTEADSAIKGLFRADNLSVEKDREGIDERLVEAGVMEVEELLELPLEGIGI